jgi:hypothetical protein
MCQSTRGGYRPGYPQRKLGDLPILSNTSEAGIGLSMRLKAWWIPDSSSVMTNLKR